MKQPARILIAESEELVARDLTRRLEGLGYVVVASVQRNEEAITVAASQIPDLILMDIALGGNIAGIETARIIRARYGIPVVYVISQTDVQKTLDRAKRTQAVGYIVRPFSETELRSAIDIAMYNNRIEKQLKESERRYRLLAENAADMISIHDPSGVFLYASPACKTIFSYEPEDLLGRPACHFVHPEDVQNRQREWSRTVQNQETRTITYRVRRSNGAYVWVETTHQPVLDPETRAVCEVTAVSRDISERKKAEELLRQAYDACEKRVEERTAELVRMNAQLRQEAESHRKTAHELGAHQVRLEMQNRELQRIRHALEQSRDELAHLYDHAPVGYVALDGGIRVHSANLTACSVLGVERHHLIGKPLLGFAATEEDSQALCSHCSAVLETCAAQSCEIALTRSDGTLLHAILESVAVEDASSDSVFCRTIITDVTERKEAQEAQRRWAQVFQHAEWGVAISDPEAKTLTIMNPAFARMHGYKVHELTGRPLTEVVAPEKHGELEEHVRQAAAKGHHTFEAKDVRKDGTAFPVLVDVTLGQERAR